MHTHRLRTDAVFPEVPPIPRSGVFQYLLRYSWNYISQNSSFFYGMRQRCQQWSWVRSGTWKWGGCHSYMRFIADKRFWEVILRGWGALWNLLALLHAVFLSNLPVLTCSTWLPGLLLLRTHQVPVTYSPWPPASALPTPLCFPSNGWGDQSLIASLTHWRGPS